MLSVLIPTAESERALVRSLACLVPGAVAGLIREVIVADAGSADATREVADVAGCRFLPMPDAGAGLRLQRTAQEARGPWLLFLRPGAVLDHGWVAEAAQFIDGAPGERAAIFSAVAPLAPQPLWREMLRLLRARRIGPGRGLLIAKDFYRALGGHADRADCEAELLRRIGRRRIAILRSPIAAAEG